MQFDDDDVPETQPEGTLGPPGGGPPTAVGVATPPPPPRAPRPARYPGGPTGVRLIALGILGTLFVGGGIAVGALGDGVVSLLIGASGVVLGGSTWLKIATRRRRLQGSIIRRDRETPRRGNRAA